MSSQTRRTAADRMIELGCENLEVTLTGTAGSSVILSGVDFGASSGEFVSVLGQSGSGKTTLLRALGGLIRPTGGTLISQSSSAQGRADGVVTVFQDYTNSLLSWRTVARNVALGIERELPKSEVKERVQNALDLVQLTASADEYPWRLSGGMQQRVQIARALATRPRVLLMDEPFGALDAMTRARLQDEFIRLQTMLGMTVVFVTHDVEEAIYLSDRVIVLKGRPARVDLELDVDIPKPRDQVETKEDGRYLKLRHRAYAELGHVVSAKDGKYASD